MLYIYYFFISILDDDFKLTGVISTTTLSNSATGIGSLLHSIPQHFILLHLDFNIHANIPLIQPRNAPTIVMIKLSLRGKDAEICCSIYI